MKRNPAITFAVAYQGYHQAVQEGNENGQSVYQDMLVNAADELGISDDEMHGLGDHRRDKAARDQAFLDAYYRRTAA